MPDSSITASSTRQSVLELYPRFMALTGSPPDPALIRLAYRRLYKSALRAVQYSHPARYTIDNTIRRAFRKSPASDFHPARIGNTILFLQNAAKSTGLEHKIVKNLAHVRYWQWQLEQEKWKMGGKHEVKWDDPITRGGYRRFEDTLRMLNESMGLCLR